MPKMYSTRVFPVDGRRWKQSKAHKKAARVFPEPVGEITRACRPVEMASQASDWAAVGVPNVASNQALVGPVNRFHADFLTTLHDHLSGFAGYRPGECAGSYDDPVRTGRHSDRDSGRDRFIRPARRGIALVYGSPARASGCAPAGQQPIKRVARKERTSQIGTLSWAMVSRSRIVTASS